MHYLEVLKGKEKLQGQENGMKYERCCHKTLSKDDIIATTQTVHIGLTMSINTVLQCYIVELVRD